jgi:bifunctional NMN adenylyltransferase/nudix hydrolase
VNVKVNVVIGRFQVPTLHEGHLGLLKFATADADHLVVLLGVSEIDGMCAENPLLFTQREHMIRAQVSNRHPSYDNDGFPALTVLPLHNRRNNDDWSRSVDETLKKLFSQATIRLFCGRDSFKNYYTGTLPVVEYTPDIGDRVSGTDLRKVVPMSVRQGFLEGQVYALNRQFPHAYPTVDIALWKPGSISGPCVLLIQRADTGIWAFPGGFVDPTDDSLEAAARRELYEETGVAAEDAPVYVGSTRVKDWRYRGRDKIVTSLFAIQHSYHNIKVAPEEVRDTQWAPVQALWNSFDFAEEHEPLHDMLIKFFESRKVAKGYYEN